MKHLTILFWGVMSLLFGTDLYANSGDKVSHIGHWGDDEVGLPCFHYTGTLPAVGLKPDGQKAKIPEDPWFLLGNYQMTLFTHVSGRYELITGQRAWGRMNQGKEVNTGENASVVKVLDNEGAVQETIRLVGIGSEAADVKVCQRTFGCGFAQYIYTLPNLRIERTLSVAPSCAIDGGVPVFLLDVRIRNTGKEVLKLKYEESVLAHYVPVQFQRQNDCPLNYRNEYVADRKSRVVKADVKANAADPLLIPSPQSMSMYDAYPPSLFIKLVSEGDVSYGSDGKLEALSSITLKKNEEKVVTMAIGFTFDKEIAAIDTMVQELVAAQGCAKASEGAFSTQWLKVLPSFKQEKDEALRREMRWHAYNLEAMATYSSFYKETKIPQGTIYDYYWGQHASARDNFQHALPLIYYNPSLAKSVLRYMAKRTTSWGEIRLVEYGNGYAENMVYNTSDQQLFFFMLLSEYLRVTEDYAFLDEAIEFFPYGNGGSGTMLDCVKQCFFYLKNNVGVGAHGLVRLLNSDWNDNVFVAKQAPYNTVINSGESHMNTTMAISILGNLIPLLEAYGEGSSDENRKVMVDNIVTSMRLYRTAVYDAFMADLGDRTYSRWMYFNGEPIGSQNMFLEPQSYMLQIQELPVERKKALYEEMQKRVYANEKLGARQQQDPEFSAPGLENGSRENGGFWYSLNGPAIVGISTFDKDEAWRLFRQMTFDNYAKQFPQYWTSYWSASDNIESSLMAEEEGLPDQSFDYAVIPVYCAHPHAWILYCYYRLNE